MASNISTSPQLAIAMIARFDAMYLVRRKTAKPVQASVFEVDGLDD
jgi:hypothetical protein